MPRFFGRKRAEAPAKPAISLSHYDVIVAPHITEKATLLSEHNAVVFKVSGDASKPQIKAAVEALFGVNVTGVNTITQRARPRSGRAVPTLGRT